MVVCARCGGYNPLIGARFCVHCGARLETPVQNAEPQSSRSPDVSVAPTQNDAVGADSVWPYGGAVTQPSSSASSHPYEQGTAGAFSQPSLPASDESFDQVSHEPRVRSLSADAGQVDSRAFGEAPTAAMPVVDEKVVEASVHSSRDFVDDSSAAVVHGSLGVAVTMFDAPAVTPSADGASESSSAQPSSDGSLPPYGSPAPFFQSLSQVQGRVSEDDIPTAVPGPVQSDIGGGEADASTASLASAEAVDNAGYYGAPHPGRLRWRRRQPCFRVSR